MASKPQQARDESMVSKRLDYFSAESVAQAIHEQREKCRTLHEARSKAHGEMRQASSQHEFLVVACRVADDEERELLHRLKELCCRQAMEMVA